MAKFYLCILQTAPKKIYQRNLTSTPECVSPKRTEKNYFLSELKEADAVFFNGGDTRKLLAQLRTCPDLQSYVENKTVAGSSAGAYALAAYGASHTEKIVRSGLGFVPLRVICHYESQTLPPSSESVTMLEQTAQNLELVHLKDYEWRVFQI